MSGKSLSGSKVVNSQPIGVLSSLNRFNRLAEKSNSIPNGLPSSYPNHYNPQIIKDGPKLSNGGTPLTGDRHQQISQNDLVKNVKPLTAFDHFMKNTSSTLMKGKETPTQA